MLEEPLLDAVAPRPPWRGAACLAAAIALEVLGTMCMRLTRASEWWRVPAYVAYGASFSLFPWITRELPLALAYATWSAVGSAAIAVLGVLCFDETLCPRQWVALGGIVLSVAALHA